MPPAYKSVPAIEKCFTILNLFSKTDKYLGISEISKQLTLNKSTVFNIIYTLVDLKVLDDLGDGKFGFGPHFFILGSTSGKRSRLLQVVHPYLERINKETRLPAFLGIRSHLQTVLIDKADWAHGITLSSAIGMQMPVLGGVGIKAMLSLLHQDEVEKLIGSTTLERFTDHSITDKGKYIEVIDKVRREGIAFDREEYVEGMLAAGVPIKPHNRQIQAAVWIVGLQHQLPEESLLKEGELLKGIAQEINQRLGW
ncbi:transcriptional regulator, IclR family [Syntrophus gentianae]|uniref:Transcriptional regulator, IclR family n=1 Tax=Syntrophus gentianae TaxID=43775 RepID=A0A1H7Z1Z0_9BACT|nr:IclR family transcriptional regulator [Syntrophus gentianae]SEM51537.1 transcriptional regulator, IclR family [Syntrophus gentianae]